MSIRTVNDAARRGLANDDLPLLARGKLHEVHMAADDRAAALLFALGAAGTEGQAILWFRTPCRGSPLTLPYGDGLVQLGIDPRRLILIAVRNGQELLRAGLDAARCTAAAAVVMESSGALTDYDLTASRRFVLRAEASDVPVILVRGDAPPSPSAAHSRWSVASIPSLSPAVDGPGAPAIQVDLLRQRGGPAGRRWHLEWDAAHARFRPLSRQQAMPRALLPLSRHAAGVGGMVARSASA